MFDPNTHLEPGKCYSAGHNHRKADGYGICDFVGRYWGETPEAVAAEYARIDALLAGKFEKVTA